MRLLSELTTLVENLLSSAMANTIASDLVFDGIVSAHAAILPYVPNIKETTISGSDGKKYVLPDDVYSVEAIYDPTTTTVLEKTRLVPGSRWGSSTSSETQWLPIPHGYVSLNKTLTTFTLGIVYSALWETPSNASEVDFEIKVPEYAIFGMALFATSYVLAVLSTDTSQLRQYNTRVDSGTPIHNPVADSSEFFKRRFIEEMSRMPSITRISE